MRAYIPVSWGQLAAFHAHGGLDGPLRACVVDPVWRDAAPDVDEEQWEFEAQEAAAADVADLGGGVVLAADMDAPDTAPDDGWVTLDGPVGGSDTAAVLTTDLAWFGVQEIPELLDR